MVANSCPLKGLTAMPCTAPGWYGAVFPSIRFVSFRLSFRFVSFRFVYRFVYRFVSFIRSEFNEQRTVQLKSTRASITDVCDARRGLYSQGVVARGLKHL